jgi:hypothetical protein
LPLLETNPQTTEKVSQGKWFYVVGKNFGSNVGQITEVYCWENRALSDEGIAPHFTAVSSWDYVSGTSKLITVDVNNDCAGSHGPNTIAIQFYGPDQAPGEDIYTDDPGDGGTTSSSSVLPSRSASTPSRFDSALVTRAGWLG